SVTSGSLVPFGREIRSASPMVRPSFAFVVVLLASSAGGHSAAPTENTGLKAAQARNKETRRWRGERNGFMSEEGELSASTGPAKGGQPILAIAGNSSIPRIIHLLPPMFDPAGPMQRAPLHQGLLKADVVTGLFALQPFEPQNLVSFRQEFLVNPGAVNECQIFSRWNAGHAHRMSSPSRDFLTSTANLRNQCRSCVLMTDF
ncbi:MAG: hypothetical protein ABJF10_18665, partial [Chthoniobacter sp.]|uniref:hypothetical protein n=1 Tax=Chthoniobacter sp. TaxID=2510640 RepID=UPI0032A55A44